jgi:hypothetical protein
LVCGEVSWKLLLLLLLLLLWLIGKVDARDRDGGVGGGVEEGRCSFRKGGGGC